MNQKERAELLQVIADFIEMGHVENIVSMYKQDPTLYELTGDLLRDERYMVRMGMAILFEELVQERPEDVALAIPSLKALVGDSPTWVKGEAVTLLGIIGTPEALLPIKDLIHDPDPQIAEIALDIMNENER